MTDLHCDNKRCIYYDSEHCVANAVYYLHGICQTVRQRIVVKPPIIGRMDSHDNSMPLWNGKRWRVIK